MLQVIIQSPEYDKDDILNSMQSFICLNLLYGPSGILLDFLISETFMNTIEKMI